MAEKTKDSKGYIEEFQEHVGWFKTVVSALGAAGFYSVVAFAVPSRTMQAFMGVGSLLGWIFGIGITSVSWRNAAKAKRGKRGRIYLGLMLLSFFCCGLVIWIIAPGTARKYRWAEQVREFLIDPRYCG